RRLDLDQRQLAHDGGQPGHVLHVDDVDQLVEVGLHQPGLRILAIHDDGHPREARIFGPPHVERVDIEVAPPEERRHPVQHAGFVFHKGDQCLSHLSSFQSPATALAWRLTGRRIMSSRSAPAGTMGKTASSCSTTNSSSTGPLTLSAKPTASVTSSRFVIRRAGMPYAAASLTK